MIPVIMQYRSYSHNCKVDMRRILTLKDTKHTILETFITPTVTENDH